MTAYPNNFPSRREMLQRSAAGFGALALSALFADDAPAATRQPSPKAPRAEAWSALCQTILAANWFIFLN